MKNTKQWDKGFYNEQINQQVVEKSDRRNVERQGDIAYAKSMAKVAEESLRQEAEAKRTKVATLRKYMADNQIDPCDRDTFEINNPNILKETKPPRVNDADDVPVSSCQKFTGEDLTYAERTKKAQKELKSTLEKQMEEKKKAKSAEKEADRRYMQIVTKQNEHLEMIASERERLHLAQEKATADAVRATLEKHKQEEEIRKKKKAEEEELYMNMAKSSKLLTERMEDTLRIDNPNRFIPYAFKGYGLEKSKEWYEKRQDQIAEHENLRNQKKEDEKNWVEQAKLQRKHLLKIELEQRQMKTQKQQEYANELAKQAKEQQERAAKLKETFTNTVTDDFFNQFGTSHR